MYKEVNIEKLLTDVLNNKKSAEEILHETDGIKLIGYLKNCIELRFIERSRAAEMVIPIFYFYVEVNNGGFHQFLSNSSGRYAEDLKNFLFDIGAEKAKEILERISSFFPENIIPEDDSVRNRILSEADPDFDFLDDIDIEYVRSGEDVSELLKKYLIPRIHEFAGFLRP